MIHPLRWLLACAFLFIASSAWSAPRGLVIITEGPDPEGLRRDLAAAVPSGLPVVDPSAFERARTAHMKVTIAEGLANPGKRKATLRIVKNALVRSDLQAVLSARAKRARNGGQDVRVALIVRTQTEPVLEESVSLAKDSRGKELAPLLSASLHELEAPGSAASASTEAKDDADSSDTDKAPASGAAPETASTAAASPAEDTTEAAVAVVQANDPAREVDSGDNAGIDRIKPRVDFAGGMVQLEVGVAGGRRNFQYHDPFRGALRNYVAPGVGLWTAAGQLYPFAQSGLPLLKGLGLVGNVAGALPFSSKTQDAGGSADGSWSKYAGGARLRLPTTAHPNPLIFGVEVLYGGSNFTFTGSDPASVQVANEVPSVHYKFVRGGADVRAPLGSSPLSVLAAAGYMHVLSAGPFTDRFPRASIHGVDGRLGATYAFAPWVEGKLGFEYTRVFASLKPQPGDPGDIAGGSLDQFFVVNAGMSAIF